MTLCPSCGTNNSDGHNFCVKCGYAIQGATGQLTAQAVLGERYVIVRLLGKGGMGAVYLALDRRLDNIPVAVKEMSTAALGAGELEKSIESFKREARILAKLSHHALPRVTDFFSTGDGRWYLVMDYIEGETIEKIFKQRGHLPEKEVINWARQLCDVLGYLHGREPPVIFRDLKPSNIMLTSNNEIKLIDFGIARHFKPSISSDTFSFASIGFAPPEQFGRGQTDQRSDIYALGANMHYLLTGIDPSRELFKFKPPDQVVSISPVLSELIMEMLEQEPHNRPGDIGEVARRLAGIEACRGEEREKKEVIPEERGGKETKKINGDDGLDTETQEEKDNGKTTIINEEDNSHPLWLLLKIFLLALISTAFLLISPSDEGMPENGSPPGEIENGNGGEDENENGETGGNGTPQNGFDPGGKEKKVIEPDWSDWTANLPPGVNNESYFIESNNEYRYQYATVSEIDWSPWQSAQPSEQNITAIEQQHRVRSKEFTTSTNSTLSGWSATGETPKVDYGPWSGWIEGNPVASTSTLEVETKTWTTETQVVSGYNMTTNVYRIGTTWAWSAQPSAELRKKCTGWYGENYTRSNVAPDRLVAYEDGYKISGDSGEPSYMSSCRWYISSTLYKTITNNHKAYRTRTITTEYKFWRWGPWSDWNNGSYTGTVADKEIQNQYRYKTQAVTWGEWSTWSSTQQRNIDPATTREETRVVYRYKEK